MLTSAECRAQAEQKRRLAQAQYEGRQRRRLLIAAEAWLYLASHFGRVEAAIQPQKEGLRPH
jgi:hypothetical protein